MTEGPLKGLLARAIIVVDESGTIVYEQLVPEVTDEPDYESALNILKNPDAPENYRLSPDALK